MQHLLNARVCKGFLFSSEAAIIDDPDIMNALMKLSSNVFSSEANSSRRSSSSVPQQQSRPIRMRKTWIYEAFSGVVLVYGISYSPTNLSGVYILPVHTDMMRT
jgi:hypothetical protein